MNTNLLINTSLSKITRRVEGKRVFFDTIAPFGGAVCCTTFADVTGVAAVDNHAEFAALKRAMSYAESKASAELLAKVLAQTLVIRAAVQGPPTVDTAAVSKALADLHTLNENYSANYGGIGELDALTRVVKSHQMYYEMCAAGMPMEIINVVTAGFKPLGSEALISKWNQSVDASNAGFDSRGDEIPPSEVIPAESAAPEPAIPSDSLDGDGLANLVLNGGDDLPANDAPATGDDTKAA